MSTLEEALCAELANNAGVKALVSSRIYPHAIAQDSLLPCLSYQRMDTPRITTHDDVGSSGVLANPQFEIDCWSLTYDGSKDLADAVRSAIGGKKGTIGFGAVSCSVGAVLPKREVSDYLPEAGVFRMICTYSIWQEE